VKFNEARAYLKMCRNWDAIPSPTFRLLNIVTSNREATELGGKNSATLGVAQ